MQCPLDRSPLKRQKNNGDENDYEHEENDLFCDPGRQTHWLFTFPCWAFPRTIPYHSNARRMMVTKTTMSMNSMICLAIPGGSTFGLISVTVTVPPFPQ